MTPAQMAMVEDLYRWAVAANRRLPYEHPNDNDEGLQFGGNPHLNPVLKAADAMLSTLANELNTQPQPEPVAPPE